MDGMPSLIKNLVKSQTVLKANVHFTSLYMTAGPCFVYSLIPRMAIRQPLERCLLNLVQHSQRSFLCCVFLGLSKKTWSLVMEQLCTRTSLVLTNHPPHVGLSFRWVLDSAHDTLGFPGKGRSCVRLHWCWSTTALSSSFLEVEKQGMFLTRSSSFVF